MGKVQNILIGGFFVGCLAFLAGGVTGTLIVWMLFGVWAFYEYKVYSYDSGVIHDRYVRGENFGNTGTSAIPSVLTEEEQELYKLFSTVAFAYHKNLYNPTINRRFEKMDMDPFGKAAKNGKMEAAFKTIEGTTYRHNITFHHESLLDRAVFYLYEDDYDKWKAQRIDYIPKKMLILNYDETSRWVSGDEVKEELEKSRDARLRSYGLRR